MLLKNIIILNYRSCKKIDLLFDKDEPNIFIGINDCGKTSILKAIDLLLNDKAQYYFIKEESAKKDLSNTPLGAEELAAILLKYNLPEFSYNKKQSIFFGKIVYEDQELLVLPLIIIHLQYCGL